MCPPGAEHTSCKAEKHLHADPRCAQASSQTHLFQKRLHVRRYMVVQEKPGSPNSAATDAQFRSVWGFHGSMSVGSDCQAKIPVQLAALEPCEQIFLVLGDRRSKAFRFPEA